ncbi:MAG TPA: hypothetical protein VFO58_12930 [Vicinamibacterales bacterium]|nr:hypothetical protein [Vicinamibacterales bacterium]
MPADPPSSASPDQAPQGRAAQLWNQAKAGLFPENETTDFEQLYKTETKQLDEADSTPADIAEQSRAEKHDKDRGRYEPQINTGVAGEPWVSFTARDRLGLALSGGGIRSATFNLGLLQSLARLGILRHVHYLSTVSGGGYVGGFWTAWLARRGMKAGESHFPLGGDHRGGERAEVRHLREFSRFLLPRMGLRQTEFWAVVMTIVGGLLPSLVAALAVLVIAWSVWIVLVWALAGPDPWGYLWFGAAFAAFFLVTELFWRRTNKALWADDKTTRSDIVEWVGYGGGALVSVAAVVWMWMLRDSWLPDALLSDQRLPLGTALFGPSVVLVACFVGLVGIRTLVVRFARGSSGYGLSFLVGIERSLSRVAAMTALSTALSIAGWATALLQNFAIPGTIGTAGLASLFAWARKWLAEPIKETRGTKLLDMATAWLKRATPRVLATLVLILLFLLVGIGLRWILQDGNVNWQRYSLALGTSLGILLLTAWWFDPARVGLHEFYRSRISRCYLGASNTEGFKTERDRVARNRHVSERPGDDLTLGQLRDAKVRPIHLVCTAANDLSGDHLATLYRGAKSAVLSVNGISIGNQAAPLDYVRFSAALTASAAAFNSEMGRVSMNLGPAVAFLMSTLNLRLGLWVPHPQNPYRSDYWLPGRFFIFELLGLSRTDRQHLHLSDGAHFENLGLYELVRRHCRYIIVSDCGEDQSVTFDDLANVLRRVREDFGVEIEVDVDPLRPDEDGIARQHAVMGTIHYDGYNGVDKGTLLLFKPSLTGDEPPDVLQYRSRNTRFPHESTGDQFYDEAQWESYRRLGEHAGYVSLAFSESDVHENPDFTDRLFVGIRERLHPAPEGNEEIFIQMSERCAALESDVFNSGPQGLRREFFPEAVAVSGEGSADLDEEVQGLSYMMRALQIMEDVWVSADLDRYWSHPLNEGWMNYFQRWASTPTFRKWWPILRPIYSSGFRDFAKERFGITVREKPAGAAPDASTIRLRLEPAPAPDAFMRGHAWRQFVQRSVAPDLNDFVTLAYRMEFALDGGSAASRTLDVGFVLVKEKPAKDTWSATWHAHHFYVPPPLVGAGIIGRQLDAVIAHYRAQASAQPPRAFDRLTVVFGEDSTPPPRGRAAREERVRQIEFFKSRGFQHERQGNPTLGQVTLTLSL